MKKILSVILVVMFIFAFTCPVTAQTRTTSVPTVTYQQPSVGEKVVDALLVRPPCAIGAFLSTGVYLVIALPVHIIGVSDIVARAMVEAPWRFTHYRYLGEYDHYIDEKPIMGAWADGF